MSSPGTWTRGAVELHVRRPALKLRAGEHRRADRLNSEHEPDAGPDAVRPPRQMIGPEAVDVIQDYVVERDARFGNLTGDGPLLLMTDGRPLTVPAVRYLVDGWVRGAGGTKHPGELVHAFGHTYTKGVVRATGAHDARPRLPRPPRP